MIKEKLKNHIIEQNFKEVTNTLIFKYKNTYR